MEDGGRNPRAGGSIPPQPVCDHHPYVHRPPEIYETIEHKCRVWWFPSDFTQTHINGRYEGNGKKGSNACTIICILMAIRIHTQNMGIHIPMGQPMNKVIVATFAECIYEGNAIHEKMLRNGELSHMNLTVPEAMAACSSRAKCLLEWYYVQKSLTNITTLRQSLFNQIYQGLQEWCNRPPPSATPDLYLVLIADARSVLVVYQRQTGKLTLIDSHSHMHSGAIMVQVDVTHIRDLCIWYDNMCSEVFGTNPDCYELSFLYFHNHRLPSTIVKS